MYEKLSKNALKCMYIATAVGTVVMFAIEAALEIFLFIPKGWTIAHVITGIIVAIQLFNCLISPKFRYHRYRYKIDDECIDIIEGYIFVERHIVPIERLHKLEVDRGPIDRLCGVAKVTVTTAGGDVTIRFLEENKADAIAEGLKKKINAIVIEQKAEKEIKNREDRNSNISENNAVDNSELDNIYAGAERGDTNGNETI